MEPSGRHKLPTFVIPKISFPKMRLNVLLSLMSFFNCKIHSLTDLHLLSLYNH